MPTRRLILAALTLALALPGCAALRDAQPFTITVILERPAKPGGPVRPDPLEFTADWPYGEIQVVNRDSRNHYFAIRELAVFEEIPKGLQRTVRFDEARDGKDYVFEDFRHDGEFFGTMHVRYKSEEERE